MAKVLGLGGVFFKAKDTKKLSDWYHDVLGIDMGEYGASFKPESMPEKGYTAFSLFKQETEYFAPSKQEYMINFVVDDLLGLLIKIEANGGVICGKPEEYDYGKFGWFLDPEGNKVELWQPL
ncbi:VOC family protein [Psychrosphaera sp. F3M07]|jgi:predicted enzyme related to lactoylglutathione lyase|uniref:VOC family protein n=1 Tax=Psychrosphaera sp. F3M07 TaxID=2841560 RepID=UPI001C0959EA|nr:VOC family protein [Psychrosphaera sp. F3M07]MBU2916578.1 VOC family protein [Psychrosphaera sp. F3M07]